ncbi:fluoride efflux transporter CrcB [Oleisolibacter albus]|uniref:fluoride efflux transporter CrcB n=1 Tax=Oleisolibacter albus TaxID=2171757 RepID=UPI000DF2D35D|nr:fluoride efflux transporter CrcB [Oleisolibacter albus]
MKVILAVAAGGAIGSVARYLCMKVVAGWIGGEFPWGTLTVNIVGGLIMGIVAGAAGTIWSPSPELRAFVAVGILGGFTTFSTFSLDVMLMMQRGELAGAAAYVVASVLLSVGGLFAGLQAVRMVA